MAHRTNGAAGLISLIRTISVQRLTEALTARMLAGVPGTVRLGFRARVI